MWNWLAPYPPMTVEQWEGILGRGGSTGGPRGPSTKQGLSSPECQFQEESPQSLAVKIIGHFSCQSDTEAARNPEIPLKGPCTESVACRHSFWALAKEQWLGSHQSHTGRQWIAWLQGENRESCYCPCVELSSCANCAEVLLPVLSPPPTWPNQNLH